MDNLPIYKKRNVIEYFVDEKLNVIFKAHIILFLINSVDLYFLAIKKKLFKNISILRRS